MKGVRLYIYIFSVVTLFLVSCEDFLNKTPESSYSVDNSYNSQADFEYAIAGVYAAQQELFTDKGKWFGVMSERSDDIRYDSNMQYHKYGTFTDGDDESTGNTFWASFWKIINRSNIVLGRINDITFIDKDVQNYIAGEAYALRGWAYYTLGWVFGGMPLIDDYTLSATEIMQIKRSTQEETFAFAESDFKQAIELLPERWDTENAGRITKYAAMAGLARLYMFRSEFSEAKPLLQEIINSGIYAMASNYEDCFNDRCDNDPNNDRVWEIQFTEGELGEGCSLQGGILRGSDIFPYSSNEEGSKVSKNMVDAYEDGDLRKDVSIITGLSRGGVVDNEYYYPQKYAHYTYAPKSSSDWANNIPIVRYTDVLLMYAECLNEEAYVANGEAFEILNEVRSRAGLSALTSTVISNQVDFRNALIHERRVEFAFEGLRWHDLLRWNIAQEVMNTHFQHQDEGGGRYSMDGDYRKILAIPFDEMSRYNNEDVMWQNPGY